MILSIRIFLNAALLSLGLLYQSHEAQATDPVVITDLNVSSKTPSSLSLTWNVSSGNKCNFIVRWTEGSVTYSNNTYNTSYTVTGLLAGMNYPINVIVENQTTGGAQISAFTNPNAVTNLNGSSKTPSSVSLTWDKPKGSWSYFLVHWTGGDVKNTFNMFYTVTNLPVGVSHTFSVTAVAADNQTEGKATQISVFTKPDAVNNLLAANKSSSSVVLTWNETNGSRSLFEVNWTDGSASKGSGTTLNKLYTATGLTAGVNYTFTVSAVAADNQTAGAPTQISAFTVPAVVSNLVASTSNQTTSSVSLTWNEPNGSRSFFIVNWTDRSVDFSSNTSDTSYIVTGLISGTRYTFCVTAVAADGQTKGAPNQTSAFTTPGVVANLTASSITTLTVTLNWNEPFGTRSHFIVKWTDGIGNTSSNTSMMTYNVAGLTAGTNYTFTVTAVAADNQTTGAPTQISAFTKPNTVTNLTVSNKTPSSISLNWNEPNGSWSNFIVIWTDGSEKFSNKSSSTSYSVTGLTAGVNYTFTVTAVAADGRTEGAPTQTSAFTKPNPITSLTASNKTTSSVSLTWNKPQGNCSFFKVKWTDGIENNSSNTSSMFYTVTGLTAGVNYTFTVTAVAADKQTEGAPTQILAFTQPNSVTNLIASNQTTSSVSLIWSKPQGSYSFFKVKWTGGSENNSSSTSSMFYTVTGLTAGVNYLFTVTALAADGQTAGDPTQTSASTNPDAVGNLKVSKKTTSSVSLTWNETPKDWSFKLEWTNDSTLHSIITSNTSYTITGLSAGVNYSFTVTAVAADNQTKGAPTQISTFTNPEVVTNLTVSNKNSSSVSLTWNEPRGIRLFFKVSWTGGSVNFSIAYNTSYIVTGLTAGVSYTFTVTAVAADRQTEGSPTQTSAFTVPNIVSNLVAANKTTSSVSLTWNEPQGNWSFFIVKWTDGSFNNSSNTPISSYNVTGLTAGVNYTFTVTAVAADGKTFGESIQISAFTKPGTIRNLKSSEVRTTSVLLDWDEPLGKWSFFRVLRINGGQWITSATAFNFTDLEPGTKHTFAVSAVAVDNITAGSLVVFSTCTGTSPILDLICEGPNRTAAALLNLTWTNPPGNNQGFGISLNQTTSDFVPRCNNVCSYIISKNLEYFSTYSLIISTLGCGDNGTQELRCRTGITEPPVPSRPEDMAIKVTPISQSIINLQLNASLLNADNGPIEAFGVLLSTDNQSNISSISLTKIYSQWEQGQTKAYLTVLKLNENKMTRSNIITIIIGNYSDVLKNTAYKNGPLSNQEYRVALVLFTYLEIKDELVDIQQSIFSLTPFAMNVAKPLDPSSNIVAIILGVLLPIIVLLIIAVIVLVIQKRRIAKEYTDIPVNNLRTKISIPVRVEDFEAYYKKQQLDSNCGFAEQYEDLKVVGTAQTKNSALAVENKAKNRYNNVLPYDSSRVKLSIHGSPFDDYINANYISGYNSKKEYIAAQGPLPATVNEFWRMIWEKHVHTIVMLTKCYEQGRVKCDKYWPPEAKLYSNIFVTTVSEIELEDWTIRDLTIKNVKTAETRNVRQFHFTAWPDHGVPETTEVLINFRHLVREHMDSFSRNAPAVVHCSAGVGRTGTFIALDHLIFQIERDSMVDIFGIIYDMRMHRPLMVQTEDQYVFLSQCASDLIKSRMGTNVDLIYQNAAAFSIYENVQK